MEDNPYKSPAISGRTKSARQPARLPQPVNETGVERAAKVWLLIFLVPTSLMVILALLTGLFAGLFGGFEY